MSKVIIGLDPGSRHTGVGIVQISDSKSDIKIVDCDVLDLKGGDSSCAKLASLFDQLDAKFKLFQPDSVAIENVFLGKNVASALTLGQARGVCMAVSGRYGLQTTEYAPRKIKKLLTGNGAADKAEVQRHLQVFYGVTHSSADACDALAIAICHGQALQLEMRMNSQGAPL